MRPKSRDKLVTSKQRRETGCVCECVCAFGCHRNCGCWRVTSHAYTVALERRITSRLHEWLEADAFTGERREDEIGLLVIDCASDGLCFKL